MTVAEVKEMHSGEFADVEVYKYADRSHRLHTDFIDYIDPDSYGVDAVDRMGVLDVYLMDEEDYNDSILANHSETADFESWYGDKDAKVLVIVVCDE